LKHRKGRPGTRKNKEAKHQKKGPPGAGTADMGGSRGCSFTCRLEVNNVGLRKGALVKRKRVGRKGKASV